MLVLTRKAGQSVEIEGGITITILTISDYQVRIGIQAPKDETVHREEVAERIRAGIPRKGTGHRESEGGRS